MYVVFNKVEDEKFKSEKETGTGSSSATILMKNRDNS